jgi:hypothetical protein
VTGLPAPTLVPARRADGACHWHYDGKCAVHDQAPYGCAFFDSHMPADEVRRRSEAVIEARRQDAAAGGLYFRVWLHLCRQGLTDRAGDRPALAAEVDKLRRDADRRWRIP